MKHRFLVSAMAVLLALAFGAAPAHAQFGGLGKKFKDKVKQKTEERVDRKVDDAAEATVDAADPATAGDAGDAGEPASSGAAGGGADAAEGAGSAAAAARLKPGEGAWANYDFVPGERVIFAEDFAGDRVGNFPKRFEFKSGNMEIVEWQGQRWMRAEDGEFFINLKETLPERFTMEFDLAGSGNAMEMRFGDPDDNARELQFGTTYARLRSGEVDGQGDIRVRTEDEPVKIRISVDGDYVKVYANQVRALNVPNGKLGRSNRIYVNMNGWSADAPRMIANVRIAAGGPRLYDAIAAEGRVATQGILFDTGSDRIRPESTPTLKEIGDMLKEHADLRLRIEGHTDNVGKAEGNQALSQKRAEAVQQYLIAEYGIDAGRLEAVGLGQTRPAADNATAEGRQQNRRVELVRL